ncbi:MAG TPA: penicillin acylase family protein [Jatrophihabitantaceae bacterium]
MPTQSAGASRPTPASSRGGGTHTGATSAAAAAAGPSHAYRAHDYADGRAMSILPPGENGLINATDLLQFEANGTRPAGSQDQLNKYANLLYGYPKLTDSTLPKYYDDESFGVKPSDVSRTETPETGVTIYRDQHDVPHVYGNTDATLSFGAGYAQAEDRLFLMDVLRHYGEGTLASFLGSSCEFEQMDHDQLLLAPYTEARAVHQINALPKEYGKQGALAKKMIENYVAGVNAYISKTQTDPTALPVDYTAAVSNPQPWGVQDVVAIAGLIGGIFGRGGGIEVSNARLLEYLQHRYGNQAGMKAFHEFRTNNDPLAATTVVDKSFPYEHHGKINPSTTALPDRNANVTGGPTDTDPNCSVQAPNPTAMSIIKGLNSMPKHMSNALVVNADQTKAHHPIAVFGPQVSYYAPQILAEEDLHSPHYDAEGASFPGTGLVELGRGEDFAWSATSAGSDLIDQRLEKICKPGGGKPDANGTNYLYKGKCRSMTKEEYDETAYPKPGGQGAPAQLNHTIYRTVHGVVQGWTMSGGTPVAIVNQRSTYNHDVDSVVGFLAWGEPKLTHNVSTWMKWANKIQYTFNWFYVDNRDTGYFVSGKDPIRPRNVDPSLPTWGTGKSEWRGYLPFKKHVHEVNPKQGFFVSWNNKPAPGFAAADDMYGYGQVYRSILLVHQLKRQLRGTHHKVVRSDVVKAMETAASQDLDGVAVEPLLLKYLKGHHHSSGVQSMIRTLHTWIAHGAHRRKAHKGDAQYQYHAAVAISDELIPNVIRALYDRVLKAGGLGAAGSPGGATAAAYSVLPMQFVNTPNSGGAHLGSAFDSGYESYLVAVLRQLLGRHPRDGFTSVITKHECAGGPHTCRKKINAALRKTRRALVAANGTGSVKKWTASTDSKAAGQTMPVFDAIQFRALGVVGQPAIDWQNRPTFQQVVQFYRHRPR